jgi:hypothetical protein
VIRIERHEEVRPGIWRYTVPGFGIEGRSRQPLLDACRQIKSLLGPTSQLAGLFREGRSEPDISCSVRWGAEHTVRDDGRVRFAKYRESDEPMAEAAE